MLEISRTKVAPFRHFEGRGEIHFLLLLSLPFTRASDLVFETRISLSRFPILKFLSFLSLFLRRDDGYRVMAVFLLKVSLLRPQRNLVASLCSVDDGWITSSPRRNKGKKLIDREFLFRSRKSAGFSENRKRRVISITDFQVSPPLYPLDKNHSYLPNVNTVFQNSARAKYPKFFVRVATSK